MNENQDLRVAEMKDGDEVVGQFLITNVTKRASSAGKNYLNMELQDSTGSIDGKKWDVFEGDEATFANGNVVQVRGKVLSYNNSLQFKVLSGEKLDSSRVDFSRLVPSAPVSLELLKGKLQLYIDSIGNPDVKALLLEMIKRFEDKYFIWPAAVRNHHNYLSGLLYHSITMCDLAAKTCEVYHSLNRDIVLAGVIIHDMGKTVELSAPQATQFTLEGKLLGHISIGQAELRAAAKALHYFDYDDLSPEEQQTSRGKELFKKKEIAVCLEHIVLSHHTKPEFGSPVAPLTREALAVAMIDDLDAKMMILDKAFAGVEKGGYTQKLFTMDDRYFYLPEYSVENPAAPGTGLEETKSDLA
ncbi:MAG: HD domain-containing protein [Bacilli bacterium]|nr:HD domain-containing protein [Bacilli bacterium]